MTLSSTVRFLKQADVLEGAGDARPLHADWIVPVDPTTGQTDFAFAGRIDAGDEIEDGRLSGAVGADQAEQVPLVEGQVKAGDRREPAEPLADLGQFSRPWPDAMITRRAEHRQ